MMFRLVTEDQRDRFCWMWHEGRQFHLCNPSVENGGLGIHEEYHLVAYHRTSLWPTTEGIFPPFPYVVKSCVRIAQEKTDVNGLFGNG